MVPGKRLALLRQEQNVQSHAHVNVKSVSLKHLAIAAAVIAAVAFLLIADHLRARKPGVVELSLGRESSALRTSGANAFLSPRLGLPPLGTNSPTPEESLRALGHPSYFHQLNRERHFTAVILASVDAAQPLCSALLESPVWVLSSVSPAGYLFRQAGQKPWQLTDPANLGETGIDPSLRSEWMILTAMNLIAIGRNGEAESLLESAAKDHPDQALLAGGRASLAASRGQWNEALASGRVSLAHDPGNQAVRETVIRALVETGRSDEALDEARKLVARRKDAATLFLLARTANTANSSREEIAALQDLVAYGRQTGQPLGASLSYLGQALARNGERGAAIMAFREAMNCPELSPEEQKVIREMADHIALERKP